MDKQRNGKKASLSKKIFHYLLIATFFPLIFMGLFWIGGKVSDYEKDIAFLKERFSTTKKLEIKNKIFQIKEFIYWARNNPFTNETTVKGTSGNSEKIIQEYILDSLGRLRYAKDEYVFINTLDGKALISNGRYNREPINIFKSGDMSWISIFRIQQSVVSKPKGFFYSYKWRKISSSKIELKTSYFNYLPEWKWIIGTGFYEDDINKTINLKRKVLYSELKKGILTMILFLFLSTIICFLTARFLSKKLGRNIGIFRSFFEQAALGNIYMDKSKVSYQEFGQIADSANLMIREAQIAKARIRESEAYYQAIFENTGTATVIIEEDTIISVANTKFEEISGYPKHEIENKKSWKDFVMQEDLDLMTARHNVRRSDPSQAVKSYEFRFINRSGGIRNILLTIDMIPGTRQSVASLLDITERKQNEEKIMNMNLTLEERIAERTAQLVMINKELESFSYSISHDLRAPLRAINGFSQILSHRHRSSLNDEGRQYMNYIVEASLRMEQLINDLLHYARLGRKSLNLKPVSLNIIVNDIYLDFKQKLEEIGAQFTIENNLPQIRGDESLLRQIFTNLIENAIKYRRPDIKLKIIIGCEFVPGRFNIKVSDNGIGIKKEYWEKIFNIFQRLHSEEKYPGTGIGLATVRKAVELMNGTVRVESVFSQGSTFILNFHENTG